MKKIYSSKPIESEHTLNAAFKNHEGRNYICTTVSGSPALLNIYDLDSGETKASFELENSLNCWNHIIGADGRLYVMTYARLYRYDFSSGEFKSYGSVSEGEGECFAVDCDDKGNIYFGSCPGGKIIKFNVYDESIKDFGQIAPGVSYIRSLSFLNGYLYCGVKGDSLLSFYKVDAENAQIVKEIPIPGDKEYYPDGLKWVYTSTAVGDKIIIHNKADNICPLLIYDTVNENFIETGYKGNFPGLFVSPERNGKCYFVNDGRLMEICVETGKVTEADFPAVNCNGTPSVDFITDTASGKELMIILNNDDASVECIDLEAKTSKSIKLNLIKGSYYIQTLEAGDFAHGDRGIYLSGYCGDRAVRYDTVTGEIRPLILGQAEGMTYYEGVQYMGIYPGNKLYSYDCRKDGRFPVFLGKKSEKQDRPFAMCSGDGKIFMGTVPDYGLRGGDIVIYDIVSGTEKVIKEPVKGQSIIGLAYENGILYGSTSVWGGLSAIPDSSPAKLFMYDINNNKLLKCFTPEVPGCSGMTWIGGVALGRDGNIWAVTGNTLFLVDFQTEKVINHICFGEYVYSMIRHRWRPTYIRFDSKGNLYTNINGIQRVNPENLEHCQITGENEVFLFALDDNDRIYYAVNSNFYIMENNEEDEL